MRKNLEWWTRRNSFFARIEVLPEEIARLVEEENRTRIAKQLKEYGFDYVTLDLLGYRTGSMNETLTKEEKEIKK